MTENAEGTLLRSLVAAREMVQGIDLLKQAIVNLWR